MPLDQPHPLIHMGLIHPTTGRPCSVPADQTSVLVRGAQASLLHQSTDKWGLSDHGAEHLFGSFWRDTANPPLVNPADTGAALLFFETDLANSMIDTMATQRIDSIPPRPTPIISSQQDDCVLADQRAMRRSSRSSRSSRDESESNQPHSSEAAVSIPESVWLVYTRLNEGRTIGLPEQIELAALGCNRGSMSIRRKTELGLIKFKKLVIVSGLS